MAVNHYLLSIDHAVSSNDENNIKICLSILGCYELLINVVHTPKERIKYAQRMIEFIEQQDHMDLSQLSDINALEIASYKFAAFKTLALKDELIKHGQQFITCYEGYSHDENVKQNFSQTYQLAKNYLMNIEKAESNRIPLKRKRDVVDAITNTQRDNNQFKLISSSVLGTKIRFYKESDFSSGIPTVISPTDNVQRNGASPRSN